MSIFLFFFTLAERNLHTSLTAVCTRPILPVLMAASASSCLLQNKPIRWWEKIILVFAGLLAALVILEIGTRLFWSSLTHLDTVSSISFIKATDYKRIPPPGFYWPGMGGNIKEFDSYPVINSLGFHDKEYPTEKPPHSFRIVILGDSFVEAVQVSAEKTFHDILEKKLNQNFDFPIEVIALGRSGYGIKNKFETLASVGLSFKPDLIIQQFLSNDLIDDSLYIETEHRNQQALRRANVPPLSDLYRKYLWVKASRFNQVLALKMAQLRERLLTAKFRSLDKYGFIYLNVLIFAEEYSQLWERAWQRTKRFILETKNLSEASGAHFLLVSFPELWRVGTVNQLKREMASMTPESKDLTWNPNKTDVVLRDFCRSEGIHFFSLLYPFREGYLKTGKRLHYYYDMHMNEHGHQLTAEVLFDYLIDKHLIKAEGSK